MYRLAWIYSKSARWREKRDEALTLLERASAAGDIFAKHFLARSMAHGWFGLRRIPEGIRLIFRVGADMAELIKDEKLTTPKDSNEQLGFLGNLARLCPLGAIRIPA